MTLGAWQQRLHLPAYIARHPANRGHVTRALARSALFQLRGRLTGKPAIARIGDLRMWVHIGNAAATRVIYGSPPDWSEMLAWKRLLHPGDTFIDVGANVGTYTLWAAGCGARVIAVEPDPEAARRLRANIDLNPGIDVDVVQAALADRSGTAEFTIGLDSQNRLGPGRAIQTKRLDDVVGDREIAGIKIDVEGFEELVLNGGRQAIDRGQIETLQLEWNTACITALGHGREPIVSMLTRAGYRLARPDREGVLHTCSQPAYGADVFALRDSSLARPFGV